MPVRAGMRVIAFIDRQLADWAADSPRRYQGVNREAEGVELPAGDRTGEVRSGAGLSLDVVCQDDEQIVLFVVAQGKLAHAKLDVRPHIERQRTLPRRP